MSLVAVLPWTNRLTISSTATKNTWCGWGTSHTSFNCFADVCKFGHEQTCCWRTTCSSRYLELQPKPSHCKRRPESSIGTIHRLCICYILFIIKTNYLYIKDIAKTTRILQKYTRISRNHLSPLIHVDPLKTATPLVTFNPIKSVTIVGWELVLENRNIWTKPN